MNKSRLSDRDLAFVVRALNVQMRRDFVPAWSADKWAAVGLDYRLPGGDVPWNVEPYTSTDHLPPGSFWPMTVEDTVPAGELGDHTEDAGIVTARTKAPADPSDGVTASHEATEMRGDPTCDIYVPGATFMIAAESSDPVEGDSYPEPVQLFEGGELRTISLSNFILPAWFVPGAPPPYDFLGYCKRPLEIRPGGYLITMKDGKVGEIYADESGRARLDQKKANAGSRVARRLSALA